MQSRGYAQQFPTDGAQCLILKMRALIGVNARCDVLTYLALNGTGHPREVARELYYSQKAIHDLMTDMACSGAVISSRSSRERIFRISADSFPILAEGRKSMEWINWPILLSTAEAVWKLVGGLHTAKLDPLVETSEIILTMKPLLERLTRFRWVPAISSTPPKNGLEQLQVFGEAFEQIVTRYDDEKIQV